MVFISNAVFCLAAERLSLLKGQLGGVILILPMAINGSPTFFCFYLFSFHVSAVANDNAPVPALRPGFLSTFALATDQGSKLGLSKNKSIICYYNDYQVTHHTVDSSSYKGHLVTTAYLHIVFPDLLVSTSELSFWNVLEFSI